MKHQIPTGIISQRELAVREAEGQIESLYRKQRALTELMQPLANAVEALDRDSFMPATEKPPQMAAMQAELDEKKAEWRQLRQERERLECALVFQKDDLRHAHTRAGYLRKTILHKQAFVKKMTAPPQFIFTDDARLPAEARTFIHNQQTGEIETMHRELLSLVGEEETPLEAA